MRERYPQALNQAMPIGILQGRLLLTPFIANSTVSGEYASVIDVRKTPADYLSLAGHQIHAPRGVGALYVSRKHSAFSPLIHGRHQERNLRGGTECVPLIVGMGKAAELARKHLPGCDKKACHVIRESSAVRCAGSCNINNLDGALGMTHRVPTTRNSTNPHWLL